MQLDLALEHDIHAMSLVAGAEDRRAGREALDIVRVLEQAKDIQGRKLLIAPAWPDALIETS
jgi:hypothetical protein